MFQHTATMKLLPSVFLLFVTAILVGAESVAAFAPKKIVVAFGEYTSEVSLNMAKSAR
jgi:hypothetical protein